MILNAAHFPQELAYWTGIMIQHYNKNEDYEIWTPHGWEDFEGIFKNESANKPSRLIKFSDGNAITATSDHRFFTDGDEVIVGNLGVGDELDSEFGRSGIVEIEEIILEDTYEIFNAYQHVIVANSIHSHQCDEFAFVPRHIQEEFWSAILPTLSCLAYDTMVLTQSGFEEIGDLHTGRKVGDYFNYDNLSAWGRYGMEPVSHGYVSPHSETNIIRNEHGIELETTLDHPLFVARPNGGEMVPSKDLTTDDYLRVDIGMEVYGTNTLDSDWAYMLGGYTAKGWSEKKNGRHTGITIPNIDETFRDVYLNSNWVKPFNPVSKSNHKLACYSYELCDEFEKLGIDLHHKCDKKVVPKFIFSSDRETIGHYLAGLFDGDGSVTDRSVNLTSTSKKLIKQVQQLLLNMGIVSRVHINDGSKKKPRIIAGSKRITKKYLDSYSLDISASQYEKFLDSVPIRIKHKVAKCQSIIDKRKQDDLKQYMIPVDPIKSTILDLIELSGKTKSWFRFNGGIRFDKSLDGKPNRRIPLDTFKTFSGIIKELDLNLWTRYETFFTDYSAKCTWSKISNFEKSENVTYDFTVPGTHSFLQNGILGSNTGGSCIISSTPNGDSDKFAELWRTAELGDKIKTADPTTSMVFKPKWIKWDMPPGRDEQFKTEQIALLGEQKWLQEYECEFLGGEGTLLDNRIIIAREKEITEAGVSNVLFRVHDVPFFTQIKAGGTYVMGVDPATGTGKDYTTIEVVEFPSLEQVMEYRSNSTRSPEIYALMKNILTFFTNNDCEVLFSVENNGVGEGIISLYAVDETLPEKAVMVNEDGKNRFGFTTTDAVKLKYSNKFKMLVETGGMLMHSMTLLKEIKNFARSGKSYAAKSGSTDDLVSAYLIIIRVLDDMAQYDEDAYEKLYALAVGGVDAWSNDDIDMVVDDDYDAMPIII